MAEDTAVQANEQGFLILYNNFNHAIYEVCFGTQSQGEDYLDSLRGKYGREIEDDGDIYFFQTKQEAIEFVSSGIGVLNYNSVEEYKQKQLAYAEEMHFQNIVYLT